MPRGASVTARADAGARRRSVRSAAGGGRSGVDHGERVVDRLEHLDAAREHRRGGIRAREASGERRARGGRGGREPIGVQRHARQRPDQVRARRSRDCARAAPSSAAPARSSKVASKSRRRDVEARATTRCVPRSSDTRTGGAARRARRPAGGSAPAASRTSAAAPRPRRARGRSSSPSARSSARVGMRWKPPIRTPTGFTERPPSRIRMRLPSLRSRSARSTSVAVAARDLHRVVEAEEVRRREEHHVQQVALDPLAGVVEPAQRAHRRTPARRPRPPRSRAPRSSDTRPGRCRRCAPPGRAARRRAGRARSASKKRGGS